MWYHWIGDSRHLDVSVIESAEILLARLKKETTDKRILKATFFIDIRNRKSYDWWTKRLNKLTERIFEDPLLVTVIPQSPIDAELYLEAWYLNHSEDRVHVEKFENGQMMNISCRENRYQLLVVSAYSLSGNTIKDAESCFQQIQKTIDDWHYPLNQMFRHWNYIGNILEISDGRQNYQRFNEVRARYFSSTFFPDGYPAATGIGMNFPGVIVEACFLTSGEYRQLGISNPMQLSAHQYSEKVLVSPGGGKSTPKFERAKAIVNHEGSTIFVSGTAAVIGEDTSSSDSPEEQTVQTLQIIQRLIERENLERYINLDKRTEFFYKYVRIYIKNGYISDHIKEQVEHAFPDTPSVYLTADICRDRLLVEIEVEIKINCVP